MEKCPTCEREFRWIQDFPLIEIVGFERLPLPEIIVDLFETTCYSEDRTIKRLPKKILKLFQKTGAERVVHKGVVYWRNLPAQEEVVPNELKGKARYASARDITNEVKSIIETEEVQKTLFDLENLIGKEVRVKELLNLLHSKKVRVGGHGEVVEYLSWECLENCETKERPRRGYIKLVGNWLSESAKNVNAIDQNLAELHYKGKINQ